MFKKNISKLTNLNVLVLQKDVSLGIGDIFRSKYNSLDFYYFNERTVSHALRMLNSLKSVQPNKKSN